MHGERLSLRKIVHDIPGSSPRAWGTLLLCGLVRCGPRFIPTCMGNAVAPRRARGELPVHPHVHGERCAAGFAMACSSGSSPRAWGTLQARGNGHPLRRFIPTCMGNASPHGSILTTLTVHPHVHGERRVMGVSIPHHLGSSPRAWGTRVGVCFHVVTLRFIPTCMGNAWRSVRSGRRVPVHPHVHGERSPSSRRKGRVAGSSPRAWGTHTIVPRGQPFDRFIPTCMGNAWSVWVTPAGRSVHPHVHGERPGIPGLIY